MKITGMWEAGDSSHVRRIPTRSEFKPGATSSGMFSESPDGSSSYSTDLILRIRFLMNSSLIRLLYNDTVEHYVQRVRLCLKRRAATGFRATSRQSATEAE